MAVRPKYLHISTQAGICYRYGQYITLQSATLVSDALVTDKAADVGGADSTFEGNEETVFAPASISVEVFVMDWKPQPGKVPILSVFISINSLESWLLKAKRNPPSIKERVIDFICEPTGTAYSLVKSGLV